jgi:hypothetical protein
MEACTQEERITRIEISVTTVGEKVDGLTTDVKMLTQVVQQQVLPIVAEHERALRGENGNVGLIAKVVNTVDILTELNRAMKGEGEKPGLIAVIDNLVRVTTEWNDTKKWASRLVWGWGITTLLMIVLELLKK